MAEEVEGDGVSAALSILRPWFRLESKLTKNTFDVEGDRLASPDSD